jgi:hypothetical protein
MRGGNVGLRSLVVFVSVVVVMASSYVHLAEAVRRIERHTSETYGGKSVRGSEFEGMSRGSFPPGFVFGTGSSAYQVSMQINSP